MSPSNRGKLTSWLLAAGIFAAWAILLDCVFTRIVIAKSATSEASRVSHLMRESGAEIPVFGASRVATDYNPENLGDDVFNYGMYGTSLDVVDALLQIECKKPKRTPIVVDLNPSADLGMGDPAKFPPFAYQPEIRQLLTRIHAMQWRYWIPGLRYFGYYDWYLRDYISEHASLTRRTVRGYEMRIPPIPFDRVYLDNAIKHRLADGYGYCAAPPADNMLFDIISNTPQRTFVLVYTPLHSACFVHFTNAEAFASYETKLRGYTNVVLLDWSRMKFPDESFHDTLHLTEDGAKQFSARLAKELDGLRPPRGQAALDPARSGLN